MKAKRIHWKEDTIAKVATEFVRLRKEIGLARLEAIRQAQLVIDASLRRTIRSANHVCPGWEDAVKLAEKQYRAQPAEPVVEAPPQLPLSEQFLDLIVEKLAEKLAPKLAPLFYRLLLAKDTEIKEVLAAETAAASQPTRPEAAPAKQHKKKVVIVGMRKDQFDILEKEFPQLNLVFAKKDLIGSGLDAIVKPADWVLSMTGKTSHPIDGRLKQLCKQKRNYKGVHGGITSFRHQLKVLLATE